MPGMKRDMGGAAGILGAFRTIALSGCTSNRVVAVLCLAENSVVCPGRCVALLCVGMVVCGAKGDDMVV